MTLLSTIGRWFGRAYGVVKIGVGIGRQMLPFVRAAREVVPQVDQYLDQFEAKIVEGEQAADDFLDRNLPTLNAMEGFYAELEVVGRTGREFTEYAISASQTVTPDALEPAEVQELVRLLNAHRLAVQALATKVQETELEKKLESLE
jgi:hypothetical protein